VREIDPLSHYSDEELLRLFCAGHTDLFGVLVRRYQRELYGYLRRYLGNPNLADDVFQATFLQVFLKAKQYEPGRPVRPWLYTIATNQAIDAMRRVARQTAVSLDHTTSESPEGDLRTLLDLLESREEDPFEASQEEEKRRLVRDALEQLSEGLRQVVILAYYQGLKQRDIADILGIPVGTVKSRLHTALAKLHEIWNESPTLQDL
jgi:RNA polymerase sigma-70 factor, ECF subfamily